MVGLLSLICVHSIAQAPLSYSQVIQQEGVDAQTLYDLTRNWFAQSYVNSKAVLQDQNSGKELTGHGSIVFETNMQYSSIEGYIEYLIDIQFKDGRMRIEMGHFKHVPEKKVAFDNQMGILVKELPDDLNDIGIKGAQRKMCYKYFYKHALPLCQEKFNNIVESLKLFIEKREAQNEDW